MEHAVGISAALALGDVVSKVAPRVLLYVVSVLKDCKDSNRL